MKCSLTFTEIPSIGLFQLLFKMGWSIEQKHTFILLFEWCPEAGHVLQNCIQLLLVPCGKKLECHPLPVQSSLPQQSPSTGLHSNGMLLALDLTRVEVEAVANTLAYFNHMAIKSFKLHTLHGISFLLCKSWPREALLKGKAQYS